MSTFASVESLRRLFLSLIGPHVGSDCRVLEQVRDEAAVFRGQSDDRLRSQADQLRKLVRDGRACMEPAVVVPAFALVEEAVRRTLGIELFDVQLLAGLALARGAIAEMATGEGKTLAAALPAFLHSLGGQGVHVATPNAYLAERDSTLVRPILQLLGTSVGLVADSGPPDQKRAAYACDVAYATGYELGFDYLRDRLEAIQAPRPRLGQGPLDLLRGEARRSASARQPRRVYAIIDEIDSVLIDEACLPLILSDRSDPRDVSAAAYVEASRVGECLRPEEDYLIDTATRRVTLTNQCLQRVYSDYVGRLRFDLKRPWAQYIEHAVAAKVLHRRDVDYVVRDGKILLVDEFTGRIFADRSWRDGLHQAVEAKEGLLPSGELKTAARISRQRFFRLYTSICGMTGTAAGSEREFWRLYRLRVTAIPLRKPCRREILPTRFFGDAESKWQAVVEEVAAVHNTGRPVLVGSRTIENSELLAQGLTAAGVPFQLLNGKQDRQEAEIVAMAGQRGAVTIATNMAGRGTDIRLGAGVADLGGLHVVGVECHESQRIDRQLLGRAGRQGDPGSGRFFVSADDALVRRFGPRLRNRMQRLQHDQGELLQDLSREVAAAQRAAEAAALLQRRQMLALDVWLDEVLAALGQQG